MNNYMLVVTVVLMILNIGGTIDIPWWAVFLPVMLEYIFMALIVTVTLFVYVVNKAVGG